MTKKTIIIAIILIIFFVIGGGFWQWEKIKKAKETKGQNKVEEKLSNVIYKEKVNMAEDRKNKITNELVNNNEIKKVIKDVLDNKVVCDKKDNNIKYYEKEFKFSQNPLLILSVTSYDYEKEGIFTGQYENLKWEVRINDLVNTFNSLKEGSQIVDVFGALGKEKGIVELKKIGERNFEVYDTNFKPGGDWVRNYVTYDEKNRKLIFITFSFVYYEMNDPIVKYDYNIKGKYFENITYPEEIDQYLKIIEQFIGKIDF